MKRSAPHTKGYARVPVPAALRAAIFEQLGAIPMKDSAKLLAVGEETWRALLDPHGTVRRDVIDRVTAPLKDLQRGQLIAQGSVIPVQAAGPAPSAAALHSGSEGSKSRSSSRDAGTPRGAS